MEKIKDIIEASLNNSGDHHTLIRAVYHYALSLGQERVEAKIRANIESLPENRYKNVQADAINYVLQDNPCAKHPPVLPDFEEIGEWEVAVPKM